MILETAEEEVHCPIDGRAGVHRWFPGQIDFGLSHTVQYGIGHNCQSSQPVQPLLFQHYPPLVPAFWRYAKDSELTMCEVNSEVAVQHYPSRNRRLDRRFHSLS